MIDYNYQIYHNKIHKKTNGGSTLKKRIFTIIPLIFVIFLILLESFIQNSLQHNTKLEASILSIVKADKVDKIDIHSLTDFTWDTAFIFQPYTDQEWINEQLSVRFKDPCNIDIRDDIYLLVFLNEDKVVQYAEINRQQSDFHWVQKYLTPTDALLTIERY